MLSAEAWWVGATTWITSESSLRRSTACFRRSEVHGCHETHCLRQISGHSLTPRSIFIREPSNIRRTSAGGSLSQARAVGSWAPSLGSSFKMAHEEPARRATLARPQQARARCATSALRWNMRWSWRSRQTHEATGRQDAPDWAARRQNAAPTRRSSVAHVGGRSSGSPKNAYSSRTLTSPSRGCPPRPRGSPRHRPACGRRDGRPPTRA